MQIEAHFPTLIGVHQVDQTVVEKTLMAVRQWETTDSYKRCVEYSKSENLNTSYHTYHDILGEIKLSDLRKEIENAVEEYSYVYTSNSKDYRIDSWINYFEPGNYEAEHNHFGNYISGVYYVQATLDTGNFQFYEPAKQKGLWQSLYSDKMKSSSTYSPKTGKMILFPSYLDHSVLRNMSSSTRISIAFNIHVELK
jgi:uncharacterized protein (TIGR02466 family)